MNFDIAIGTTIAKVHVATFQSMCHVKSIAILQENKGGGMCDIRRTIVILVQG
jgi:hypothetical protein